MCSSEQMAAAVPTDKDAPMTVATLLDKMLVIVDTCHGQVLL